MKEKTIKKINTTEDFLDGLVFGSCRYYIGRHTIHSSCAAKELAIFLRDNPTIFNQERRKFLARDIRSSINDILHWAPNINVDGFAECGKPDALVLLVKKISEIIKEKSTFLDESMEWGAEGFNPAYFEWHIDLRTNEVTYHRLEKEPDNPFRISEYVSDLDVWSKLAGWLDPYLHINAENGEHIVDGDGFWLPMVGRYQGEEHQHIKVEACTCDTYIKNPWIDAYVDPDYVTAITYK